MSDPLFIDSSKIPPGVEYNWKRDKYQHIIDMQSHGWRYVPPSRHPETITEAVNIIRQGGLILMERGKYNLPVDLIHTAVKEGVSDIDMAAIELVYDRLERS